MYLNSSFTTIKVCTRVRDEYCDYIAAGEMYTVQYYLITITIFCLRYYCMARLLTGDISSVHLQTYRVVYLRVRLLLLVPLRPLGGSLFHSRQPERSSWSRRCLWRSPPSRIRQERERERRAAAGAGRALDNAKTRRWRTRTHESRRTRAHRRRRTQWNPLQEKQFLVNYCNSVSCLHAPLASKVPGRHMKSLKFGFTLRILSPFAFPASKHYHWDVRFVKEIQLIDSATVELITTVYYTRRQNHT